MVKMNERTLRVTSHQGWGAKMPAQVLGEWLTRFPVLAAYATRQRCEGASVVPGKRPAWLDCMADTRYLGHEADGDATLLHFSTPTLGDAAPELFRQQTVFELYPPADYTALDILAETLGEVERENADSDRFDRTLLQRISRLRSCFADGFDAVRFPDAIAVQGATSMNLDLINTAERWTSTPQKEQEARLVGNLDAVVWSSRGFVLVTKAGERVRGVLVDGDQSLLKEWLGKTVLVHGRAVFRPGGGLLRIEARGIESGVDAPPILSRLPKPAFGLQPRSSAAPKPVTRDGRQVSAFGATFGILKDKVSADEWRALFAELR
jgi:hypothetical protein